MNLPDLIKLARRDSGKIFIMNSEGDLDLVVISADHYQKLANRSSAVQEIDVDKVNKEIMEAQIKELENRGEDKMVKPSNPNPAESKDDEAIDPSFDF
jgi:hypothetical protein